MDLRPVGGGNRNLTVAALLLACLLLLRCDELVRRPVALRYRETTRRRFMNPYYARNHLSIGLALRNCSLHSLTVFW